MHVKRFLKIVWLAVKFGFIAFFLLLAVLVALFCFRRQRIPACVVDSLLPRFLPTNVVARVDSMELGFVHGVRVSGLKVYDVAPAEGAEPVLSADSIYVDVLGRTVAVDGARYPRLPDGYYAAGNQERNCRIECQLPEISRFKLTLTRPEILGISPSRVTVNVEATRDRLTFDKFILDWPDTDEAMSVDGFCYVDFGRQVVYGEVRGLARQPHIRPLLEALDVPVAFPYFDGFTEVPRPVPSWCGWKVNLVNSDLDLYLQLRPELGKYNGVKMDSATGKIHLHVYTREDFLNYHQTIGPISAKRGGVKALDGTVTVIGTNGYNAVEVDAKSTLPIADLLHVAGFEKDYVDDDVTGASKCRLTFRFPRAMTNNYELLNGSGHVEVRDGQIMRMKGFRGLLDAMPSVAPAISWFTDSTQASCDYVIENGVVKTDNLLIEGSLFSIKMYGSFDAAADSLDFTVRVQFTKEESLVSKLVHPLTWPFTKLLLEFRLTGSSDDPKWKYISVIDRVLEVVK